MIASWLYSLPSLHEAMGAMRGFYKVGRIMVDYRDH
jgi:hypothetical protein